MSSTGFANGEPEVVGSIPTTQTIRVVGRADMQPPFKRIDPGSTPGRPTKFNQRLSSKNMGVWQNGDAPDS